MEKTCICSIHGEQPVHYIVPRLQLAACAKCVAEWPVPTCSFKPYDGKLPANYSISGSAQTFTRKP